MKFKKLKRLIYFNQKVQLSRISRVYVWMRLSLRSFGFPPSTPSNFSILVVLDPLNRGWVIEKLARNLVSQGKSRVHIELSLFPRSKFKVVHWMHYLNVSESYIRGSRQINTFLVPHVDSVQKLSKLEALVEAGGIPIFMSSDQANWAAERLGFSCPFTHISPGSDVVSLECFNIVIASNYYPDGRKNEDWVKRFITENPDLVFTLTLIGKSWGTFVQDLKTSKVKVEWYGPDTNFDLEYALILKVIRQADLFLYTGFDEGSLGALDAYLLGVPLLISDQGFHKNFEKRGDISLFSNYEEFSANLRHIILEKNTTLRRNDEWAWSKYSDSHIQLWEALFKKATS